MGIPPSTQLRHEMPLLVQRPPVTISREPLTGIELHRTTEYLFVSLPQSQLAVGVLLIRERTSPASEWADRVTLSSTGVIKRLCPDLIGRCWSAASTATQSFSPHSAPLCSQLISSSFAIPVLAYGSAYASAARDVSVISEITREHLSQPYLWGDESWRMPRWRH